MRQIVLDTETTGLGWNSGHRVIEIGCVELFNRRVSGRVFHKYLNPEREIDEGARAIHGLTRERLQSEPKFAEIAAELLAFIGGAELIMHNAEFDIAFLDMEWALLAAAATEPGSAAVKLRSLCPILDTLALARERHTGQRNNLDALCKRYGIDNSHRELHGALLDARILADVFLAMTGGQSSLQLDEAGRERGLGNPGAVPLTIRPAELLRIVAANDEELAAHAAMTALLEKASGGKCVWLQMDAMGVAAPSA